MKKINRSILTFTLFILGIILLPFAFNLNTSGETSSIVPNQIVQEAIILIGNEDFLEFSQKYKLPGNGSLQDPFIIEKFDFSRLDGPPNPFLPLFYLSSISYHIIIFNSIFSDDMITGGFNGGFGFSSFKIINGSNLTIFRNTFSLGMEIVVEGDNMIIGENNQACELSEVEAKSLRELGVEGHFAMSGNHNIFFKNCFGDNHWGLNFLLNNSLIENNIIPRTFVNSGASEPGGIHGAMIVQGNENIIQNNIINSGALGIYVGGLYNIIFNNTVTSGLIYRTYDNTAITINGDYTSVVGNSISNSYGYGVHIRTSNGQTSEITHQQIIYNNFMSNNLQLKVDPFNSQAFDQDGETNFSSNYWDDHTNLDENQDGIADDPYLIINNTDNNPLIRSILSQDVRITEFLNQLPVYKQINDQINLINTLIEELSDEEEEFLNLSGNTLIFIGVSLITILGFGTHLLYQKSILSKISSLGISDSTRQNLKELFNGKSPEYLFIANNILRSKKGYTSGTIIPEEIFEFKFLMHPVRLSMMKLVTENPISTSSEIKEHLKLSWGEFSNHLRTMKKANFIDTKDQFIDGIRRQVVIVTDEGNSKYVQLVSILQDFLTSQDLEAYLHEAVDFVKFKSERNI